jgi:hypothetical protein
MGGCLCQTQRGEGWPLEKTSHGINPHTPPKASSEESHNACIKGKCYKSGSSKPIKDGSSSFVLHDVELQLLA